MTFEEARREILAAIDGSTNALHVSHLFPRLADTTAEIAFEELEIDSLSMVEISLTLEERTGVELDLGDFVAHPGVNALAGVLVLVQASSGPVSQQAVKRMAQN